ncbi:hypothetical protein V5799_026692 [Amblyomma americanum]|uniref:BPTI/Kunitz inhibitor domain-containing protein n=1 Tax=Amblyomma americanum TaxID=6943 RepID=A0AAQ4DHU9_AMBAM
MTLLLLGMLILICSSDRKRNKNPRNCFKKSPSNPSRCFSINLERWYYNRSYRFCFPFSYNGCNAKGNVFPSCHSCMQTCTDNRDPQKICEEYLSSIADQ